MKYHELKLSEKYYLDKMVGRKNFEIRKNDRDFNVGDIVRYIEVDSNGNISNGNDGPYERFDKLRLFTITTVVTHDDFPEVVPEGYVVFGDIEMSYRDEHERAVLIKALSGEIERS